MGLPRPVRVVGGAGRCRGRQGGRGGEFRLEWPPGRVVAASRDMFRAVRVRGDRVAWFQERGDTVENGALVVASRDGTLREIRDVTGFTGMAWGPSGTELWVSTARDGQSQVEAVDLSGRARTLLTHAGRLEIQDVEATGRVLAVVHSTQRQVFGRARGKDRDEDIGWLDAQAVVGMTRDGSQVLLTRLGQWNQVLGHLYLRPLEGGPALDFGEGGTLRKLPTLSPDGRWILTCTGEPSSFPAGRGAPASTPSISRRAPSGRSRRTVRPSPSCSRSSRRTGNGWRSPPGGRVDRQTRRFPPG